MNNRIVFSIGSAIGLAAVAWVGLGFVRSGNGLALAMSLLIAGVYGFGVFELARFRSATAALKRALGQPPDPASGSGAWLQALPPELQAPVRLRLEGERVALPGPMLVPTLVGLLVMLGMLGTFLGMVMTFQGAVFALEGSTDLDTIRAALAAPIKGLGLSFGTSVAGVAASAVLGLLSALCRRERLDAARALDHALATSLRPLSFAQQRQEVFQALRSQAQALPDVADRLQALAQGLEQRSAGLERQLREQQARFHGEAAVAYQELAQSVAGSLQRSLEAGARAAGDSLRPVVESALERIAHEAELAHRRTAEAAQVQLGGISETFGATARGVAEGWDHALQAQARAGAQQARELEKALAAFSSGFDQRAQALLASVEADASRSQAERASSDGQRMQAWTEALEAQQATLRESWKQLSARLHEQQVEAGTAWRATAADAGEQALRQSRAMQEGMAQLAARFEELLRARAEAEARWTQQQGERMDGIATLWRAELGALREEESVRGHAAVQRLDALQTALASHLATLGAALEAPMTRLMNSAAEVPQAAAGLLLHLQQETVRMAERDQQGTEERAALMERLRVLLHGLEASAQAQQSAVESMVGAGGRLLEQAGERWDATLKVRSGEAAEVATQLQASAIELACLGQAFGQGVTQFGAASEKLVDSLQRVDGALGQSLARSDEQLAYYVAQAREVIDLSLNAQQQIVEDLHRLRAVEPAA